MELNPEVMDMEDPTPKVHIETETSQMSAYRFMNDKLSTRGDGMESRLFSFF